MLAAWIEWCARNRFIVFTAVALLIFGGVWSLNRVPLDALPLNPNGKLDLNALPPPAGSPTSGDDFVAPRTEIEELIAQMWRELLKVECVGAHDNFFELGGHSLLAAQAAARIRELLGVEPDLKIFLQAPTPAALAQHIDEAASETHAQAEIGEREEIEI